MKLKQKLTIILLFLVIAAKAQVEDIELTPEQIKITADKVCQCLEKIPNDAENGENAVKLCFGTAVLTCIQEFGYMDKITGDQEGLSEELGNKLGKKIGEKLGVSLVANCPAFLKFLNKKQDVFRETETQEGILTSIESNDFTFIVLKDDDRNMKRFLWLTPFKNAALLQNNFKAYKGKRIIVHYKNTEPFYNPKTNKYQKYRMITNIEVLD